MRSLPGRLSGCGQRRVDRLHYNPAAFLLIQLIELAGLCRQAGSARSRSMCEFNQSAQGGKVDVFVGGEGCRHNRHDPLDPFKPFECHFCFSRYKNEIEL